MNSASPERLSTRTFAVAVLVVSLLLAAGISFYASSSPDGLNRVAEDEGFAGQERDSAAAGSPLAGYATEPVGDDRLSGAVAGVVGVGLVLLLTGGLAYVVRRRTSSDRDATESAGSGSRESGSGSMEPASGNRPQV